MRDFPNRREVICTERGGLYGKVRAACFNPEGGKNRWTKRFPINVNEGLSQKDFFFSLQLETGGQVLMLTSQAGSRGLTLKKKSMWFY